MLRSFPSFHLNGKTSCFSSKYLFNSVHDRSIHFTKVWNFHVFRPLSSETTGSDWISIRLGKNDDDKLKQIEMEQRIKEAEGWVSKKLSDKDAQKLNELLGLDEEILSEKPSKREKRDKSKMNDDRRQQEKFRGKVMEETFDAKIRGFLELNPQMCSGCGAPFQTKNTDSPGYLSGEKFSEHKVNAAKIRNYQDAIKILYDASIDLESDTAETLLRQANLSEEIVQGVKFFADRPKYQRRNDTRNSSKISKDSVLQKSKLDPISSDSSGTEINLVNDIDAEANPRSQRRPIKMYDIDTGFLKHYEDSETLSLRVKEIDGIVNEETMKSVIDPICICQRCFKLQQYGTVEQTLRPGWSSHELLTPERFESLLGEIQKTKAVVLCLVDIFDLHGSLLPNLKDIAGNNPIVVAANKIDLLPGDAPETRLKSWIVSEIKDYCNLRGPRDQEYENRQRFLRIQSQEKQGYVKKVEEGGILRSENVHLISCQSGKNIDKLLASVMTLAEHHGEKIYVMGAANVGKSSFINKLLAGILTLKSSKQKQASKKNDLPQPTISNLPGTTLDFLKIRLPNGISVIDTPGLLNPGQLTAKLSTMELKQVIPVKPINAVTFRLSEGKTVLIGGLARIELLEVSLL